MKKGLIFLLLSSSFAFNLNFLNYNKCSLKNIKACEKIVFSYVSGIKVDKKKIKKAKELLEKVCKKRRYKACKLLKFIK
jgi:hypothetical protein